MRLKLIDWQRACVIPRLAGNGTDQRLHRRPGPRGTGTHNLSTSGDRPVRGLILISPGTAEHEFVPVDAG